MDYKAYLDKFVVDLYKRFDDDEERRETFQMVNANYKSTLNKLDELTRELTKSGIHNTIDIIDNTQFIQLMGISQKTAQAWRNKGIIAYSQIGNKIYYCIADIKELLEKHHIKADRKED